MLMNKNVLRTEFKAKRKQIADKKAADIAITKRIIANDLYRNADVVLTYVSFGDEVDTRRLIVYMIKNGKKVAVPYCQDNQMYFFEISSPTELILGKDGIPTVDPIGKIPVRPTENTLCIVPALAFDKKGNRLGYGGGYYDRYLTQYRDVKAIGLCFDNCITSEIPVNNLDVKIPLIFTEIKEYNASEAESEAVSTEKENTNEPVVPAKPEQKKFEVHISDTDYNTPAEIDEATLTKYGKKRFEVKINDNDYNEPQNTTEDQPEYKGEVYFGNREATRNNEVKNDREPQVTPVKRDNVNAPKQPAKKTAAPKKKNGFRRHFVAIMAAVIIIFTCAFSALGISCINDVLAIGRDSETVTVNIPENATTDEVIEILADNGIVKQELFCKIYYKAITWFKNLNKDVKPGEPVYKSGPHYVDKDMGLEGCLLTIRGIVKETDTVSLVFPEGWTIYQIIDKLDEFKVCEREELLTALNSGNFDYDFIDMIPDNANRTFSLEGYIFPDTYEFYEESDANTVIRKFLNGAENNWSEEKELRAQELGMSRDEIIIIASIIQREAANKEQMSMISAVLHNRLNESATYPTLECDSTANYIENFVGPLSGMSQSDYYIYEHSYNTYSAEGLPPGPICNPGEDAINAALYPSEAHDDYYFFRHDKYGKIYMARNDAEHVANGREVDKINVQY